MIPFLLATESASAHIATIPSSLSDLSVFLPFIPSPSEYTQHPRLLFLLAKIEKERKKGKMRFYTLRLLFLQLAATSALSITKSFARSSDASSDATTSSSSSSQLSYEKNLTNLIHPNCTANANFNWCGLVLGMVVFANDTVLYNISVTDSSCQRVGRADNVLQNSTTHLSTSVGDWTFRIYDGSGLDMVYNGLDIGNASLFGDDHRELGLEEFNMSAQAVTTVIYGDYGNCTPASEAKSDSTPVRQSPGVLAMFALGVVSLLFLGLL